MALLFMLFAAGFAALSNFFMRKSLDAGGSTRGYLAIQMGVALLIVLLLGPAKNPGTSINLPIAGLGILSGLLLALMLYMLGKALQKGPPGLTFSILSSATVMPSIVLAMIYGASLGCEYTWAHGVGSILVILGLFWAGKGLAGMQDKQKWIQFSATMFFLHVALLVIFQWRGILTSLPAPEIAASLFTKEVIMSQWYLPMLYVTATMFQLMIYLRAEKRFPNPKEWVCGVGGGIGNGLCTYLMILGSEVAIPMERAIMFPLFSIGTIIFSNIWSQLLYREKVHWKAAQVCALGILIGTVNWDLLGEFSSNTLWQKQSTAQKEESRNENRASDQIRGDIAENQAR